MPGFVPDFAETARWHKQDYPSDKAFAIARKLDEAGFDATVVWLTVPPEPDVFELFEGCEAVVVWHYLGTCNLVYFEF